MANFTNNRFPWPTKDHDGAIPQTGGNTRLLFCEQDNYKTRKGKDDLDITSTWTTLTAFTPNIESDTQTGYRGISNDENEIISPENGDWYFNNLETVYAFREYQDGWSTIETPTTNLIGLGSAAVMSIWGDGIYQNEEEARSLFDTGVYDPDTYNTYDIPYALVFYDIDANRVKTVRGDYEVTEINGSTTHGDIFYVVPRVLSAEISETTENIPIEFLGGGYSANKAQAGGHNYGNGFSIAASEEGMHLFLRTLCNSRNDDIEIRTRRKYKQPGTITYSEITASDSFYLGKHSSVNSAANAALNTRDFGDFFFHTSLNILFYFNGQRWIIITNRLKIEFNDNDYIFPIAPSRSVISWDTLDEFRDALDAGDYDIDFVTVDGGAFIIHVADDDKVYQITGYTAGEDTEYTDTPIRQVLPNSISHVRDADVSAITERVDFTTDIEEGVVVQLNVRIDAFTEDKVLLLQIDGYDHSDEPIREQLFFTKFDNGKFRKTDLYFATPPDGKTTTYKVILAGGEETTCKILSKDLHTEVTFNQNDGELLPGWTVEVRKGTIPFTYVGVLPNEASIAFSRNTALQLDMTTIAFDAYPYTDLQGNKVDLDDGSGSEGVDISDQRGKGLIDFVEASDTLFTGWQGYLELCEPGTVTPIRVPLTDATFSIDHKLNQAQLIVGDRRPGPLFRSTLRDVMIDGTILFTRERDWVRLFRNNTDFKNPVIIMRNAAVGGFPYELHIELGRGQLMSSPDPQISDIGLITQAFSMKFRETVLGRADDFRFKIITDKWVFTEKSDTVGGLRIDGSYS